MSPLDRSTAQMISELWPLSRSYEYAAELGLSLRLKRPVLWAEWPDADSHPMPQSAGLAFLRWLEDHHRHELDLALPHLLSQGPTHMRSELNQSFESLHRDYSRRLEEIPFSPPERSKMRVVRTPIAPHVRSEWNEELFEMFELDERDAEPVSEDQIKLAHSERYWEGLRAQSETMESLITPETPISSETPDQALAASGAVCEAVRWSLEEGVAFAAVSPGSHHAERSRGGGSCVVNNLAVAARYAQRELRLKRMAILDVDAHHGNGTEEIFYEDKNVLTVSVHQHPFFPGTGGRGSRGRGAGLRANKNHPLARDRAEARDWERACELAVIEIRRFKPELILVELSADAHVSDPVSDIRASDQSFAKLAEALRDTAGRLEAGIACELGNSLSRRAWLGALSSFTHGLG